MVPTSANPAAATGGDDHYDLVIIGGGPAGYGAALYGAAAGLHVALIEKAKVGGPACTSGASRPKSCSRRRPCAVTWRRPRRSASTPPSTACPGRRRWTASRR
ncbi:MAG: FAD-dependent oxidoreductase [Acidimicrobiales bacterium]